MRPWRRHSLLIALKRDARTFVYLCLLVLALPFAHAAAGQDRPAWASICSQSGNTPFGTGGTGSHDGCGCLLDCGCTCPGHSKIPVPVQAAFFRVETAWSPLPDAVATGLRIPAVLVAAHGIRAPPVSS